MEHRFGITALITLFVSFSALLPAQSHTGKYKLVLHSERRGNMEAGKNMDTKDFLLLYAGELENGELYVKISKLDHTLQASLLDRGHRLLWEIPVSSERIIVSTLKNFFVVASDAFYPYHRHEDGRIQLKGFTCYGTNGQILSYVPNTVFFSQVFITKSQGIILLTQNGLESYNLNGERTWNFESRLASAELDENGMFIRTMQGNLSDNQFRLDLIETEKGRVIHTWNYTYGNELRLMHINTEMNWLLMTIENGSDWSLNLVDMNTWEVINTVTGLQSGIFSPVWNTHDQCYGFLFYKGDHHDNAIPAIGILDCRDFSFESLHVGVQKLDLNYDQLKLLPEQNLYSYITAGSVKQYKFK